MKVAQGCAVKPDSRATIRKSPEHSVGCMDGNSKREQERRRGMMFYSFISPPLCSQREKVSVGFLLVLKTPACASHFHGAISVFASPSLTTGQTLGTRWLNQSCFHVEWTLNGRLCPVLLFPLKIHPPYRGALYCEGAWVCA